MQTMTRPPADRAMVLPHRRGTRLRRALQRLGDLAQGQLA